eukprot:6172740-Pleurochrysis_carterae.AAC.1
MELELALGHSAHAREQLRYRLSFGEDASGTVCARTRPRKPENHESPGTATRLAFFFWRNVHGSACWCATRHASGVVRTPLATRPMAATEGLAAGAGRGAASRAKAGAGAASGVEAEAEAEAEAGVVIASAATAAPSFRATRSTIPSTLPSRRKTREQPVGGGGVSGTLNQRMHIW